ncbi:hypothetical protein VTN31DRAFT_7129 [Thermomyces dupontii]|uniref:uncharacterized protein n=1 Tax=Talaromyces thermophilus TaxID=28565 RepID=UPI0037423531
MHFGLHTWDPRWNPAMLLKLHVDRDDRSERRCCISLVNPPKTEIQNRMQSIFPSSELRANWVPLRGTLETCSCLNLAANRMTASPVGSFC